MQLPAAAYPIAELWPDNTHWAAAWWWLHKRRPDGINGHGYIQETEIGAYARRIGIDANELALAMDAVDGAYFAWQAANKPKGK